MGQRVFLKEYDFNLTAGGIAIVLAEAEYFRIQASSGAVSIMIDGLGELPNLQAGQGIKSTPFKRLTIRDVSGAANVGRILVSNQEFIDNRTYGVNSLDVATLASLNAARSLDAATIAALKLTTPRPEAYTGSTNVVAVLIANTAEAVFLPAANPNGVILQAAQLSDMGGLGSPFVGGLVAHTAAPAGCATGANVLGIESKAASAANLYVGAQLQRPVLIPAGLGLWWIQSQTSAVAVAHRTTAFKVL